MNSNQKWHLLGRIAAVRATIQSAVAEASVHCPEAFAELKEALYATNRADTKVEQAGQEAGEG